MKKRRTILLSVVLLLLFTACGYNETETLPNVDLDDTAYAPSLAEEQMEETGVESETEPETENKILIAYFSWAENAVQDDIDAMTSASVRNPGNVAQLAQWVSNETGGDLFSIRVKEPYPADWDGCLSRANDEKADGIRPALSETVENITEYDIIFLGYPNWWYSCPMAILSFIEEHDLSGKQIYLFCSHGTGGLAGSVRDITAALPESTTISENVFHVYQDDTLSAQGDLQSWLKELQ